MDTIRYILALAVVVLYPPALAYWFLVHPFISTWRRLGIKKSYIIILPPLMAGGWLIFHLRGVILSVEFGMNPALATASVVPLCSGILVEILCWRQLSVSILAGLEEIDYQSHSSGILKSGIYGRIRHPRYAGAGLWLIGVALLTNYLAVYLLFVCYLPAVYVISVLEERELIDRFGEEYLEYRREVPAFLPRIFL